MKHVMNGVRIHFPMLFRPGERQLVQSNKFKDKKFELGIFKHSYIRQAKTTNHTSESKGQACQLHHYLLAALLYETVYVFTVRLKKIGKTCANKI